MLNILKAVLFGVVQGITEWLPISSTGHMILLNEFIRLEVSPEFWQIFLVVIQFGSIIAVVILFWSKIFPFDFSERAKKRGTIVKKETLRLWGYVLIACIPAAVVGILFDDVLDELFYHWYIVAIALIVFGVLFIVVENKVCQKPRIRHLRQIKWKDALYIGFFQLIAAVFPGTSRSGATIIGGRMIRFERAVAAEFTFILAIPVMFGASLLKLMKYGFSFSGDEALILTVGMVTAFAVSLVVIKSLMKFIKTHGFKVFGWYRIVLGIAVIVYFGFLHKAA